MGKGRFGIVTYTVHPKAMEPDILKLVVAAEFENDVAVAVEEVPLHKR